MAVLNLDDDVLCIIALAWRHSRGIIAYDSAMRLGLANSTGVGLN